MCEDTDECGSNMHSCPVTSVCTNKPGNYECECKEGYIGEFCNDIDECSAKTHKCADNQTCENTVGSYDCKCNEGLFRGSRTVCADVDECAAKSHNCPQKSTCINKVGSFSCDCIKGFKGQSCSDIDECSTSTHQCNEKQKCENNDGSYSCICKDGFNELADGFCVDTDECLKNTHDCPTKSVCLNNYGSYSCDCIKGYQGNTCGDINECSFDTHHCSGYHNCTNNDGSYICTCKTGYDQASDGSCTDINECVSGHHDCQTSYKCINTDGRFNCRQSFLAINTYLSNKRAVLITSDGYSEPPFDFGTATSVHRSCSVTFRNNFYIFGGADSYNRQVSQLSVNRLERIGTLDFNLYTGACAVINDDQIYLCFDYYDEKQCRFSSGPLNVFHKIAKSAQQHRLISIAASHSKFHVRSFFIHSEQQDIFWQLVAIPTMLKLNFLTPSLKLGNQ